MQIETFTYRQKKGAYWLESTWGPDTSMDCHIQELMNAGWEPMNSANDSGHVRLGKTLALTALTGGLNLFFGASRTAQTITLTFKRSRAVPLSAPEGPERPEAPEEARATPSPIRSSPDEPRSQSPRCLRCGAVVGEGILYCFECRRDRS